VSVHIASVLSEVLDLAVAEEGPSLAVPWAAAMAGMSQLT
jgi:hypothetical protein